MQQAVQQQVLRVAQQLEEQIDSQLHKLDNLQEDDLERIRQRRVQELRQQQEKTKEWVAKGHGECKEIFEEKEFFKEMKGEERMICHFYRDNWPCKVRMQRLRAGLMERDPAPLVSWAVDHPPCMQQQNTRTWHAEMCTLAVSLSLHQCDSEQGCGCSMSCALWEDWGAVGLLWQCRREDSSVLLHVQTVRTCLIEYSGWGNSSRHCPCTGGRGRGQGLVSCASRMTHTSSLRHCCACCVPAGHGQAPQHPLQAALGDEVCQGEQGSGAVDGSCGVPRAQGHT